MSNSIEGVESVEGDQAKVIIIKESQPVFGMLSVVLGLIGIFVASFVISPIALVLGFIALFKGQPISGMIGIIFSILGIITSPVLIGLLGLGIYLGQ